MRFPPCEAVEKGRVAGPYGDNYGAFKIKVKAFRLACIASCGMGWDHVSVSLPNRCPTWEEMDAIKRLFWADNETVMQLHVNLEDHIEYHPFCLHLWRPQTWDEIGDNRDRWVASGEKDPNNWGCANPIPLPPKICV